MTRPIFHVSEAAEVSSVEESTTGRPYDFNMGDERRLEYFEAIDLAIQRAYSLGSPQEVRLTTGPLHGNTIWVIQALSRDVKVPLEGPLNLGDLRRLIHRSRHLSDLSPIGFEADTKPEDFERIPGTTRTTPVAATYYVVAHDTA